MPDRKLFEVLAEGDSVTITDIHGEIVTWVASEWAEEAGVVISIVNAIKMLYEKGPKSLRRTINHPGEQTGADYRRIGDLIEILRDQESYSEIPEYKGKTPQIPAGTIGIIDQLMVGHFRATFVLKAKIPIPVHQIFLWSEENVTFTYKPDNSFGDQSHHD